MINVYILSETIDWGDGTQKTTILFAFFDKKKAEEYRTQLPEDSHKYWCTIDEVPIR